MNFSIQQSIACYLLFILSNSIHEFSHALVAYLFGDHTAKDYGRLTLNPIAHLDWIGSVFIPLLMVMVPNGISIIGWGKAVPVNIYNFKHRALGDICTSLAGPLSNLITAIFLAIISCLPMMRYNSNLGELLEFAIIINISIAVFNLLPLPPLDGSHLLRYLINMREETFIIVAHWSYLALFILVNMQQFRILFGHIINYIFWHIIYISSMIVGFAGDILFYFTG
ncbi:MAG: site-2 protease family protein [Puniceicoccales bacterium]|jgi:Zn-dependent protease|nr:site-2 protease family protein [Puniceicoccales bacterium]